MKFNLLLLTEEVSRRSKQTIADNDSTALYRYFRYLKAKENLVKFCCNTVKVYRR